MIRSALHRTAGCLLVFGLLAAPLAADQLRMQSDMQSKLAGPGERFLMGVGPSPDGKSSSVEMTVDPETGEERQQARGAITLRIFPDRNPDTEPRLTLMCLELDYIPATGLMEAVGDVIFRQEGIDATAREMTYDVDRGFIEMRGEPIVNQRTGERNARFEGMEIFTVETREDGGRNVDMIGPNEVHILMSKPEPVAGSGEAAAAAADAAAVAEEGETASAMPGLGDEIDIRVAPRGDMDPVVDAEILPSGELSVFRGEGSVRLKTEEIDLRSDELFYDAVGQHLEATTNVFFKKDNLEADSGRLEYNLETGRIVLTVNPDVRQFDATKVIRIWDNDWFTIDLREGGGYDISYGSTTRVGQTEIINIEEYEGANVGAEAKVLPALPPVINVVEIDPTRPILRETLRPVPTPAR